MKPFVVVLDPGHGGRTLAAGSTPNNAVGPNGLLEKDLTLTVAKSAAQHLPGSRFKVTLTRDDDRNLSLADRSARAREAGADAFVSLHFNGHPDVLVDGTEAYISTATRARDRGLAEELLQTLSGVTGAMTRGVSPKSFSLLAGEAQLPATAACLVEIAFLSNPAQATRLQSPIYLDQLGLALAQGLFAYSTRFAAIQAMESSLTAESEERVVYEQVREHTDPDNFPINLPEVGNGHDNHRFNVPSGLKFSRWEVEVLASSPGAGYRVASSPASGATGNKRIRVAWWHPPYGRVKYKVRAYASPDGIAKPARILYDSPGWLDSTRNLVEQGQPVNLAVRGTQAKLVHDAIERQPARGGEPVAVAQVLPLAALGILVIGALIALGMLTLGAIIKMALEKGYDVKDTKYKAAAGEGATRQEHELAFNLSKRQ